MFAFAYVVCYVSSGLCGQLNARSEESLCVCVVCVCVYVCGCVCVCV